MSVSSTNKTDHHDIIERMLQVALNTINQTNKPTLFSIPHCGIESAGSTVVVFEGARQALPCLLTHNVFKLIKMFNYWGK